MKTGLLELSKDPECDCMIWYDLQEAHEGGSRSMDTKMLGKL